MNFLVMLTFCILLWWRQVLLTTKTGIYYAVLLIACGEPVGPFSTQVGIEPETAPPWRPTYNPQLWVFKGNNDQTEFSPPAHVLVYVKKKEL